MNSKRFLIKLQFLGFRYHGVQKQKEHSSIQGRIELCLQKKFGETPFQTRFASRTDAMVSALETYFLLMFEASQNVEEIHSTLSTLPADIKILEVKAVDDKFTMLKASGVKEYHYFFSFGDNHNHPYSAPFITHINEALDVDLMKEGAKLFVGPHYFKNYAYKPKPETNFEREILSCEIVENDFFTASFFPKKSYVLKIRSKGFMRGQVRLITGTLFRLGMKEISISDLIESIEKEDPTFIKFMAPPAGLILHKTALE